MGIGGLEGNLPFRRSWESWVFQVVTSTGGFDVTKHRLNCREFLWETDGNGCWGPVTKRQKYAKEFDIYLTGIKIYEQGSDMMRERRKTDSGDTVYDQ